MNRTLLPMLFLLLAVSGAARAADTDFASWLAGLRREAASQGVPAETLNSALRDLHPNPHIIELDNRQPETTLTLGQYLAKVVQPARIEKGQKLKVDNRALLRAVSDRYGVPPKIIMALWAAESSFGGSMGDYKVVESLATLAFDGRRPDLFRAELIAALKILGRGDFTSEQLKGSWAGAMGQVQFMPSTYLSYAVNFDHPGQPDIWRNQGDVFASAAHYLARSRCRRGSIRIWLACRSSTRLPNGPRSVSAGWTGASCRPARSARRSSPPMGSRGGRSWFTTISARS
jgi:membrane-bound lytic murein transglycosylase B